MKNIIKFSLFEEVSNSDIRYITGLDDYFTVSFEFEIETDDKSNMKIDFDEIDDDDIEDIIKITKRTLNIRNSQEIEFLTDLVYELVDNIEYGDINLQIFNDIFKSKYENARENEISSCLKSVVMSLISVEDLEYLKEKFIKDFPNFMKKWGTKMDFVGDATLERGIEVKPKTYTKSLSEAVEMLGCFYTDLNNQNYWKFTEKTGLHINIGSNKEVKWNPIKGLLLLNDFNDSGEVPLVFKNMDWRLNNKYCASLMPNIRSISDNDKRKIKRSVDLKNIKEAEVVLNKFISEKIKRWGIKNFGFNISKTSDNYVEFRYAGGDIPKDVLIDKLKYFSFIVYAMSNEEYKKKEYLKKIYKFVNEIS